jgi:hypothetical protein
VSLGQSEAPGLSEEGKTFLDTLRRASWSGRASANGTGVTVRSAPIFSAGMLNAVRNRASLDAGQRKDLDDVARVILPEAGWFIKALVPAGTYHLGLEFKGRNPQWVVFDSTGKRLFADAFWIHQTTGKNAGGQAMASGGTATVTISAGGISLGYRFVPKARHDAWTAALETTTHGNVRIHSDLVAAQELSKLAKVASTTLKTHASILGRALPEGMYDVYLLGDGKVFDALDGLLSGGAFKKTWAFTSRMTGWSYLRYGPRADRDALADAGLTLKARSLVLHELHHQIARRAFPEGITLWPDWLAEGLAELGALRALQAASRADGKAFHELLVGNWLHADRVGAVPPLADLVGGYMESGRTGYYTTCYLLAREMVAKPKRLKEFLDAVGEESVAPQAAVRAREEFERLFGEMDAVLARAMKSARAIRRPPPAVTAGFRDPVGDAWRIVSVAGSPARVVLPATVGNADGVTITTTFSYHPSGQQQLDLYLCHREGRHTEQFLKVAVLPKRILLFWFRHGTWRTCGDVNYDQPLAVGTTSERKWHDLRITYRVADRKVRVDTTGKRWAEFDVPGYVPNAGTHMGIGLFDGVAYVKEPVAK